MILPKNCPIFRKEVRKIVFFHNILSFDRSANEILGYFVQKSFTTITFRISAIFQIKAVFYRPSFEALEMLIV